MTIELVADGEMNAWITAIVTAYRSKPDLSGFEQALGRGNISAKEFKQAERDLASCDEKVRTNLRAIDRLAEREPERVRKFFGAWSLGLARICEKLDADPEFAKQFGRHTPRMLLDLALTKLASEEAREKDRWGTAMAFATVVRAFERFS